MKTTISAVLVTLGGHLVLAQTPVPYGNAVLWGQTNAVLDDVPIRAIAAGFSHYLGLRVDGRVIAWGGDTNLPPGLSNVVSIAACNTHSLALLKTGRVIGWGGDYYGQSQPPSDLTNATAIAAGGVHSLALKSDGSVVGWGRNLYGETDAPADLRDVIAIAAGSSHSLALTMDGTVVAWGWNGYGQTNVPAWLTNVIAIAAGENHNLALTADGRVVAWGSNTLGETNVPPDLNDVVAIAAGNHHGLALKSNGRVVAWGHNDVGQCDVSGISNVVAIAGGDEISLAIREGTFIGVLVDGVLPETDSIISRGPAVVQFLNPFRNGILLYSLNGSDPSIGGMLDEGPVTTRQSASIQAVAFREDLSESEWMPPFNLTVLPSLLVTGGGGNIAIDPPAGDYFSNAAAVITATPEPGWRFLHWLGDADGTDPVTTLAMTRDKVAHAVFGTAIGTNVIGNGSIKLCPSSAFYPFGTVVQLTAIPASNNYFVTWGGALSGSRNPTNILVTAATPTISAAFAALTDGRYTFTTTVEGMGKVDVSLRTNRYFAGEMVMLTALPDLGQEFLGWSNDVSGFANPLTVTVDQSKFVTANFTKRPTLALAPELAGLTPDGFRLLLNGEFGASYCILASTNLSHWQQLGIVTNQFGTSQFTDESSTNLHHQLFRAMAQ